MYLSVFLVIYLAIIHSVTYGATIPHKRLAPTRDNLDKRSGRLCNNGPQSRGCWKDGFTRDDDMDRNFPSTGNRVNYHLEISSMMLSPDGVPRQMMVVNGQFPGPTIYADWGDTITIVVKNSLKVNGTGLHWHGLRQLNTNDMDGVGGITECPLAPDESRTYTFQATQYGTSWYHSHFSVQYSDGILGAIVIRGPTTANYDIDLGPMLINDWFHTPIFTVNAEALHASGPPIGDNILINGTMAVGNIGTYAKTSLQPGKSHLLRLVNVGTNNFFHVALDGHPFTVVAADFVPIVPYTTNSIVLGVGQRYDVIINANNTIDNYWLRVGTGGECDGPNKNSANARSIFSYAGSSGGSPNSTGIQLPTGCYDEIITPHIKTSVPSGIPNYLDLSFSQTAASGNLVQWQINGSSMVVDWEKPTLQYVLDDDTSSSDFPKVRNVITIGSRNSWQYWIIQNSQAAPPLPHPIHLHGHDFYILAQGSGVFPGSSSLFNLNNPIRRDTATLPAGGYLVLAFESDNPGAWLMHCHIPFHISAGLGLQFLERPDDIQRSLGDMSDFEDVCHGWGRYQRSSGVAEGDSGL